MILSSVSAAKIRSRPFWPECRRKRSLWFGSSAGIAYCSATLRYSEMGHRIWIRNMNMFGRPVTTERVSNFIEGWKVNYYFFLFNRRLELSCNGRRHGAIVCIARSFPVCVYFVTHLPIYVQIQAFYCFLYKRFCFKRFVRINHASQYSIFEQNSNVLNHTLGHFSQTEFVSMLH